MPLGVRRQLARLVLISAHGSLLGAPLLRFAPLLSSFFFSFTFLKSFRTMGKKNLNPADAFRKEQKKKEIKKSKQKQAVVKKVTDMLNNPAKIEEEVRCLLLLFSVLSSC